jgi:histidine triad (HIT) family protein
VTQDDCVFCGIAGGLVPAEKLYDDGVFFAIRDINPMAPIHLLIIPHEHVESLNRASKRSLEVIGTVLNLLPALALDAGVAQDGYRLVVNQGHNAGQMVSHFHIHLLGGGLLGALG